MLSKGKLKQLFNYNNPSLDWSPFIVDITKIGKNPKSGKYVLLASDGELKKKCYLSSQLEHYIHDKTLKEGMRIEIKRYSCTKIMEMKTIVLFIVDFDIIN